MDSCGNSNRQRLFRRAVGWRRGRRATAVTLAAISAIAALFAGGGGPARASTGASCPSSNAIGNFQKNDIGLSASFANSGSTSTYTLDTPDESSVDGVPGLIEYCIYPVPPQNPASTAVTAQGADGTPWTEPAAGDHFSFGRSDGNPSNIPFDGTTGIAIGTATWATLPTDQFIVLHINDSAECSSLYGGVVSTCFVFPSGGGSPPPPPATAPTVVKSPSGAYTDTYIWSIGKSVDKTKVDQIGGSVTFHYTVTVSHDAGTLGNFKVTGTITPHNNDTGASVDIDSITDPALSDGTTCTVTGGGAQTIAADSDGTTASFECDYGISQTSVPSGVTNTATISWSDQLLTNGDFLAGGTADDVEPISFPVSGAPADNCVTVTDTLYAGGTPKGTLGTSCVGTDTNPKSFTYSNTVPAPAHGCTTVDNTATFTTNTSGKTGTAGQSVQVCGPALTGALTMGFWQNKNGQGIISNGAYTLSGLVKVCNSGTWLRQFAPFQDLGSSATCSGVATYVYNVIKAATCSGPASAPCNAMLKAQDLATSLDVYFSDPALGGNQIQAPAPIGGVRIDLTQICNMIDGSGGSGTCSGALANASSVFGGNACLYVYKVTELTDILRYAASQAAVGGVPWYGTNKANQVLAKNVFDAINNQAAFAC